MWWGGFSETNAVGGNGYVPGLNPHVVGRFFRVNGSRPDKTAISLNPHVVGRFFRGAANEE